VGILGCNSGSLTGEIQVNTAEDDEIECVAIVCIEKSKGLVLNTFAVAVYALVFGGLRPTQPNLCQIP
jgi:hypothetical protein